jgi:hypothetical protein
LNIIGLDSWFKVGRGVITPRIGLTNYTKNGSLFGMTCHKFSSVSGGNFIKHIFSSRSREGISFFIMPPSSSTSVSPLKFWQVVYYLVVSNVYAVPVSVLLVGLKNKKTAKLRHLIFLSRVTYSAPLEMLSGFCKIPEI